MPTISHADHIYGSADMATLDRRALILPCGICCAPGPHSHRIEREHGLYAVCSRCRADASVREESADGFTLTPEDGR